MEALRSPAVNLPALARSVEAAHFPDPTSTYDVFADTAGMLPSTIHLSSHVSITVVRGGCKHPQCFSLVASILYKFNSCHPYLLLKV